MVEQRNQRLEDLKPIEHVELPEISIVDRVRARIGRVLRNLAIGVGLSGFAGHVAGGASYDYVKESLGGDEVADDDDTHHNDVPLVSDDRVREEEAGFRERAGQAWDELREWGGREVRDVVESTETYSFIQEKLRELDELRNKAILFASNAAYWTAFILAFAVTAQALSMLGAFYNKLARPIDPAIEANLKLFAEHQNAITDQLNAMLEQMKLSKGLSPEQLEAEVVKVLQAKGGSELRTDAMRADFDLVGQAQIAGAIQEQLAVKR